MSKWRPQGSKVAATGSCGHTWFVTYRRARLVVEQGQRTPCGECGRKVRATFCFEGRECESPGCEKTLTRYNPGPYCFACDLKRARSSASRAA